ncbi:MAG: hypothetical protein ACOCV8_05740, partial [Spirochaetota bacterium]
LNFNMGMKFSYSSITYVKNNIDIEILSLKLPIEAELLFLYICGINASITPAISIINNRIGFAFYTEVGVRLVLGA